MISTKAVKPSKRYKPPQILIDNDSAKYERIYNFFFLTKLYAAIIQFC